jgi:2Fe-2S ferredoxin
MFTITFRFEQEGIVPVVLQNVEAGNTLLEVALNADIELHHNCGGVCSCTTCHLYIESGIEFIDEASKREQDYLTRAMHARNISRLGCQSLLREGNGSISILVPDQRILPDEYF